MALYYHKSNYLSLTTILTHREEQIYDMVWQEPYSGDYNIVMSHISHIREKIEDDPSHPVYIQTVWGVGYKFNEKMCE